jgi:hypothetical protein
VRGRRALRWHSSPALRRAAIKPASTKARRAHAARPHASCQAPYSSQSIEVPCGQSTPVPPSRARPAGLHALASLVHLRDADVSHRQALIRSKPVPVQRFVDVLIDAIPMLVHEPQASLRRAAARRNRPAARESSCASKCSLCMAYCPYLLPAAALLLASCMARDESLTQPAPQAKHAATTPQL